jgi:hypothetical protein
MLTQRFYTRRSKKRKKDSQVISHFTLLGSACTKSVYEMMVKLTPGRKKRFASLDTAKKKGCLSGIVYCIFKELTLLTKNEISSSLNYQNVENICILCVISLANLGNFDPNYIFVNDVKDGLLK